MAGSGAAATVEPGSAHPLPPLAPPALARFLRTTPVAIERWCAAGLPVAIDGRIDPFAATSWLSAGRLAECPLIARRWRRYLDWFRPYLDGGERARRVVWRRRHRLYLPAGCRELYWFLAAPAHHAGQQLIQDDGLQADGLAALAVAGGVVLRGEPAPELLAQGSATLTLAPRRVLNPGSAEHLELSALMIAVVGGFTYAYRHHRPWEYPGAELGVPAAARAAGSCVD